MASLFPLPASCDQCSNRLTKTLICSSCKTGVYCHLHWSAHKLGCSPLPVGLIPVNIVPDSGLREQEDKAIAVLDGVIRSWALLGLLRSVLGIGVHKDGRFPSNESLSENQRQAALLTPELNELAAFRFEPAFAYPKYGGRQRTDKYSLTHQLVQIIRLVLLRSLADMSPLAAAKALSALDPFGPVQHSVRAAQAGDLLPELRRLKRADAARIVPAKVLAAPGRLSQAEYLALPVWLMLSEGLLGGLQTSPDKRRWLLVLAFQAELENSAALREYDCGQS